MIESWKELLFTPCNIYVIHAKKKERASIVCAWMYGVTRVWGWATARTYDYSLQNNLTFSCVCTPQQISGLLVESFFMMIFLLQSEQKKFCFLLLALMYASLCGLRIEFLRGIAWIKFNGCNRFEELHMKLILGTIITVCNWNERCILRAFKIKLFFSRHLKFRSKLKYFHLI